jgi:hypothetical protein
MLCNELATWDSRQAGRVQRGYRWEKWGMEGLKLCAVATASRDMQHKVREAWREAMVA